MDSITVVHLGLQEYSPVLQAMHQLTASRDETSADQLWFLQHPQVFTQGQAGKAEHLIAPADIPVVQVDRGGQVTFHGPGQLVVYILIDIQRQGFNVREFVTAIEQAIIATLADFNIEATARSDAPGVYVVRDAKPAEKIASLGLKIKKGCSFHGLALNIDMDLEPFLRINPCGYAGMVMSQVKDQLSTEFKPDNKTTLFQQVQSSLAQHLPRCLNYSQSTELTLSELSQLTLQPQHIDG